MAPSLGQLDSRLDGLGLQPGPHGSPVYDCYLVDKMTIIIIIIFIITSIIVIIISIVIILMLLPHRNLHDRSPCLNLKTQQDFQGP